MQECVDAFVQSRKQALELATVREIDEHPKRKRRKISADEIHKSPPARRTRSAAKPGGQHQSVASLEIIAIDSEDDGDDTYLPGRTPEPTEPEDGLVACPMCNVRMKEETVFTHLDRCDGKPIKARSPPKLPQPIASHVQKDQSRTASPAKHLAHLNYSLLKDGPLKKKLQELGIPTWGTRQLLVRRHTQWVDIYNANSDSPRPKSDRQLLKDLDVWERTQGGNAPGQGQTGPVGVMRKDFDGSEWTGKHKDQFSDLITQARAKRKSAAAEDAKIEEDKTTHNAMEGVIVSSNTSMEPPSTNGTHHTTTKVAESVQRVGMTTADSIPSTSTVSKEITSSPLGSMLHSAAQDVRRRNSISRSPNGPISMHSISSSVASATPAPSVNGHEHPRRTLAELPRNPVQQEGSIGQAMADATSEGEAGKMKTMDMFRVPESPVNDIEGLGAAGGGG